MSKFSSKQIAVVSAALLVAIAILLAAIFLSPSAPKNTKQNSKSQTPITPGELPPSLGINSNDLGNIKTGKTNPLKNVQGATFTRIKNGHIVQLKWKTLAPAAHGISFLTKPRAKVIFSPTRVLTISANKAKLLAPANHLQKAQFVGNVVATLYISKGNNQVNTDSVDNIAARIYLQKTILDAELSTLSSSGQVYVTGPNIEFLGSGLKAEFGENSGNNQFKKLVIEHGKSLRLHLPQNRLLQSSTSSEGSQGPVVVSSKTKSNTNKNGAVKYFQAVFSKDVHIKAPSRQINMQGDNLKVILPSQGINNKGANHVDNVAPSAGADNNSGATENKNNSINQNSEISTSNLTKHKSLTPRSSNDITIKWDGKLVITPVAPSQPAMPKDGGAKLVMAGSPVKITRNADVSSYGANSDKLSDNHPFSLQAAKFTFLTASQTIMAEGIADAPLVLAAPGVGNLSAAKMKINTKRRTAQFYGAGNIAQADKQNHKGLNVSWDKGLSVKFFDVNKKAGKDAQLEAFGPIKTAEFSGNVHASHPQFNIKSSLLYINFAKDSALVKGKSGAADRKYDIYPSRILARGNVAAKQDEMSLAADSLDLTLAPSQPSAGSDMKISNSVFSNQSELAHSDIKLQQMIAAGNVKVNLNKRNVKVDADQLIINQQKSKLIVLGTNLMPAKVMRQQSVLSAQRIVMNQNKATVDVPGSGELRLDVMAKNNGKNGKQIENEKTTLITRWDKYMHFQRAANTKNTKANRALANAGSVEFSGSVVSTTENKTRATRLQCGNLKLSFAPVSSNSQANIKADKQLQNASTISQMSADNDVIFTSHTLPAEKGAVPSQRFRLEGSRIDFDRASDKIYIPGAGKMLVENHSPKSDLTGKQNAAPGANSKSSDAMATVLSGSGQTLFAWDGGMTINTKTNSCKLVKNVWMIHHPASGGLNTTLSCQRLMAQMSGGGGLGEFNNKTSGSSEKTKLKSVSADGKVRISQAHKQIDADHMRYAAAEKLITLWADQGNLVTVHTKNQPTGFAAGVVKWNLATDTFEAQKVQGGIAPAGR